MGVVLGGSKNMASRVSSSQSLTVSGLMFLVTLLALQLFSSTLASTNNLRLLGGFGSATLCFCGLVALGSLDNAGSRIGWIGAILCVGIAVITGSTIHPLCITTSFLFSVGILFYLTWAAKQIYN